MISVIIPYVEDRGYLDEALKSLHNQSYENFEIVFSQGERTQGQNINAGLVRARGEFIKILHDDDVLPPNSLRDLRRGIGDFAWACADFETFGEECYCDPVAYIGRVPLLSMLVNKNNIGGGTTLYRKDVLNAIGGYDETLWTGEEYELHMRLLHRGYACTYIPKIVHRYRLHEKNKSYYMGPGEKKYRRDYIKKIANKYGGKHKING